jgi:alpha-L-fucosidase
MRDPIIAVPSALLVASMLLSGCATTPPDYLNESRADFDARMEWWRDARFGMFIHWGLYAVPAGVYQNEPVEGIGEWIMNSAHIPVAEYEEFAAQFNPTQFDAAEWVRIAKDAGMKYIVITSKHHDGFSLWDSKVSQYDIIDATPFGRDILRELADAAARQGIRLGFYHSIMDWHHPDAQAPHFPTYNTSEKSNPNFPRYVENYLKPQVRELVTTYGPVVLWFDGEWIPEWTHEMVSEARYPHQQPGGQRAAGHARHEPQRPAIRRRFRDARAGDLG